MLRWRVDFARLVLRIELECDFLAYPRLWNRYRPYDLHAGEKTADGRYLKSFVQVEKNVEGVEMKGGERLFSEETNMEKEHIK